MKRDGFAAAAVLPGEDAKEFKNSVIEVCNEFKLEGGVEQRLGLMMAALFWRLDHLEIFDRARRARAKYAKYFENSSDLAARKAQLGILAQMDADRLREMALRKDEENRLKMDKEALKLAYKLEEWTAGVADKAHHQAESEKPKNSMSAPVSPVPLELRSEVMSLMRGFLQRKFPDMGQMEVESDLAQLGNLVTPERYRAELDMKQEISASISRCLRLIMQVKTMKQNLRLAPNLASTPRLEMKSGKPPRWGDFRLVTTKRR